jgi:glucan phosphoethanolaminetransferase (alkaline phosphatase superfamily)
MSDDNNEDETFESTDAIIDMLKEAGVSTQSLEDNKEHKFWDTQVRNNEVVISSL